MSEDIVAAVVLDGKPSVAPKTANAQKADPIVDPTKNQGSGQ